MSVDIYSVPRVACDGVIRNVDILTLNVYTVTLRIVQDVVMNGDEG